MVNHGKRVVIYLALFLLMVLLTNPVYLPMVVLVVPYSFLGLIGYHFTMYALGKIVSPDNVAIYNLRKRYAVTIAIMIMLILAMQSIGQLTIRDVSVLFGVVTIGIFYLNRNHSNSKSKHGIDIQAR